MSVYASASGAPLFLATPSLNPSSIPAFSKQTETFTVTGVTVDMIPTVKAPSLEAGVFLLGAWVSAANELTLVFENGTSAAINPAAQNFQVVA